MAVHSSDAVIREGLVSFLQHDRRLEEVPADRLHEADAVVTAFDTVDAAALEELGSLAGKGDARFLVVAGRRWQAHVSAAIDRGVRAVLWRDAFTPTTFVRTLLTVADGGGSLPPTLLGTLMEQVQWTQREVLGPHGLTSSGVSPREVDVLRLVSEGRELSEIATALCYSERTVKYTLYSLMKRLQLRNRAHAVSYAIRAGLI
ncbi:helix-turn-helix transcriptional regulator [Streptantibioticus parmotrematis]|uniref:helix-turn-helix transcriptional regulator n=1 Tax=Streptantibioticus parmotrematis TaxID=2873249 RepID=UPI0027E1C896|nr:response regulator transcription factor [Streptantibioticus parmotrematis]